MFPRCAMCGKKSLKILCAECRQKTVWKKNIFVRCIVCGKKSTTTLKKYETEPYKCGECR